MRLWTRTVPALAALALLWAGFAYAVARPPGYSDYHRTVVQAAEGAHDATVTGWLTGRQVLAGQVIPPFATTAFDDATKSLAGANQQFAAEAPPDERSRRLRDELSPLLQEAVLRLGEAAGASGDDALRAAVDALHRLADRLEAFVEAHR